MEARLPMTPADAAWLHMDRPTNLMIINSVLWFDEPVDWKRLREVVEERLVDKYPKFGMRVVESHIPGRAPHWEVDPDFDLDTHLHHVALPAPGDMAALQTLVSDLVVRPLDHAHPLWEMYLIDGYGPGAATLCRMHHCVADGIALARVMLSLTDEERNPRIAPAVPMQKPRRGLVSRVAGTATDAAGTGRRLAGAVLREGVETIAHPSRLQTRRAEAEELVRILLKRPDTQTVLKGRLRVADTVTWSDPIPLDLVKEIGHTTGSTVNDVLVTAMTGALHDYLRRRDSLVDDIRAFVPFNLRPLDQPLPRELGNRFGLVYLDLPVGTRTAASRLRQVKERMDAIKASPQGKVAYAVLGLLGHTPPEVEKYAIDMFSARGSCVLTNVPGPREPVYLAGTPVGGVLVWAPTSGSVSMSISIFSYAGEVTVGLLVDAGLVPDPHRIAQGFRREVDKLARLAERRANGAVARGKSSSEGALA